MDPQCRKSPWRHSLASTASSGLCALFFYPLDSIKFRFMSQDGTSARQHTSAEYKNLYHAVKTVSEHEGLGVLYRGCLVAMTATSASWGSYFLFYRTNVRVANTCAGILTGTDRSQDCNTNFLLAYMCSVVASWGSSACVLPLWVVKVRMQLNEHTRGTETEFSTIRGAASYTWRREGWRGFYKGITPQLALAVPAALKIPIYDWLKEKRLKYIQRTRPHDTPTSLSAVDSAVCSTVAKAGVVIVTNPLTVIKTRMQDHRGDKESGLKYRSTIAAIRTTLQQQGLLGFYRGFSVNLLVTLPRSTAIITGYEIAMRFL